MVRGPMWVRLKGWQPWTASITCHGKSTHPLTAVIPAKAGMTTSQMAFAVKDVELHHCGISATQRPARSIQRPHPYIAKADRRRRIAMRLQLDRRAVIGLVFRFADV